MEAAALPGQEAHQGTATRPPYEEAAAGIGQTRPVFAYRLIAENTVEDKILALQAQKRALAAGIFGEDAGSITKLSAADLELLFS